MNELAAWCGMAGRFRPDIGGSPVYGRRRSILTTIALVLACVFGQSALIIPAEAQAIDAHVPIAHRVLAFYYPWYGTPAVSHHWEHWQGVDEKSHSISNATHYPAGGPYDSHDPAVIGRQLRELKAAGVSGIVVSWWGSGNFTDEAMPLLLAEGVKQEISVSVFIEGGGARSEAAAITNLRYILAQYGSHPAFLRVDGRPVIFVYSQPVLTLGGDAWGTILRTIRQEAKPAPVFSLDLNVDFSGKQALAYAPEYDAITQYGIRGGRNWMGPEEVAGVAVRNYERLISMTRPTQMLILPVEPGYDDTKLGRPAGNVPTVNRADGAVYRQEFDRAIRIDPDWIIIDSFNEWHEGSEIEPSDEFGNLYLDITREESRKFLGQPPRNH